MAEEFSLSAKISGDTSELKESLESGKEALKEFGIDVNKITEFLTGGAGLALAFAAVAEKGMEAAKEFDEVGAQLGKTTGETGAALDSLKSSLSNVAASGVVQGISDIGKGMGELHVRLGLVGDDLEKATKQFSDFADTTGQPVAQAVTDVTKLMAQWKIPADELEITLDKITKTSQLTGESAATLTQTVSQAGPIFQAAGMSINDVLGMMTGFQKAGIDASVATQGINIALRKFAQEGVTDSKAALESLINEIATTPDKSRSATLAVENFGRAGITMGQAIRSGALDVQQWTDAIADAEGTLAKTGSATESFDGVTAKLGNQLQGLAAESFQNVINILKPFLQLISEGIRAFEALPGPVKQSAEVLGILVGALNVAKVAMVAFGVAGEAALGPIGLIIGAVSVLAIGIKSAADAQQEYNESFKKNADLAKSNAESTQKILGNITEVNKNQKLSQDQISELVKLYPELTTVMDINNATMGQAAEATKKISDANVHLTANLALQKTLSDKKQVYFDIDALQQQIKTAREMMAQYRLNGDKEGVEAEKNEIKLFQQSIDENKKKLAALTADENKYRADSMWSAQQIADFNKKTYIAVVQHHVDTTRVMTSAEKKEIEDRQKLEDANNGAILADDLMVGEQRLKLIDKITKDFIANSDERIKYFDLETSQQIADAQRLGVSQELQDVLAETRLKERAKLVEQVAKKEKESWDKAVDGINSTLSSALPNLNTVFTSIEKLSSNVFIGIKNGVADAGKFISTLAVTVQNIVSSIFGAIDKATQQSSQREIAAIDKEIAARKKQLTFEQNTIDKETQAQLESLGIAEQTTIEKDQEKLASAVATGDAIAIKEATDQLARDQLLEAAAVKKQKLAEKDAAVEEELQRKKADIAYKAAHSQWELQIIQAIAGAALAIIQGYSQLGPIGGTIMAAITGAVTGAEIGIIASNEPQPSSYATGTTYSTAGLANLAEQGPELVISPSVHNLAKGSTVLTAAQTAQVLGGKGATINVNVGHATHGTVGEIARSINSESRKLAYAGVL